MPFLECVPDFLRVVLFWEKGVWLLRRVALIIVVYLRGSRMEKGVCMAYRAVCVCC